MQLEQIDIFTLMNEVNSMMVSQLQTKKEQLLI